MTLNFGFLPSASKKKNEQSYSIDNLFKSQVSIGNLSKAGLSQPESSKRIFHLSGANSMKRFKEDDGLKASPEKETNKKKFKKFRTMQDMYYADSREKNHYTIKDLNLPSEERTKKKMLSKVNKENNFQNQRFKKVFQEDEKFDLLTHQRIHSDHFSKKKKAANE